MSENETEVEFERYTGPVHHYWFGGECELCREKTSVRHVAAHDTFVCYLCLSDGEWWERRQSFKHQATTEHNNMCKDREVQS